MTFGTPGVAHIGHLMGELMQAMAGVKLEHIPYRGGADAARDLAAGRIDAVFISESSLRPVLESGKAKPIGVTGGTRRPTCPDVPAIGEIAAGLRPDHLDPGLRPGRHAGGRAAAACRRLPARHHGPGDPGRLDATGSDPAVATPAEARALFTRDKAVIGRLMREAGLLAGG